MPVIALVSNPTFNQANGAANISPRKCPPHRRMIPRETVTKFIRSDSRCQPGNAAWRMLAFGYSSCFAVDFRDSEMALYFRRGMSLRCTRVASSDQWVWSGWIFAKKERRNGKHTA